MSGPLIVPDQAITATTSSDVNHQGANARTYPISATMTLSCWRPRLLAQQYIQIDLGSAMIIRGVTTAGNPTAQEWVTSYKVKYNLGDPTKYFNSYQEPFGQVKVGAPLCSIKITTVIH